MEINPIVVIGVPKDGEGDADLIETNWRRATESGIGCVIINNDTDTSACLLYTSPSPRDRQKSRMPSSA